MDSVRLTRLTEDLERGGSVSWPRAKDPSHLLDPLPSPSYSTSMKWRVSLILVSAVLLGNCTPGRLQPSVHREETREIRSTSVMSVDLTHDHGSVVNGVAVYTTDGDRQLLPDRPHFRVHRIGSTGIVWLSGHGYAIRLPIASLHHYGVIRNGVESKSTARIVASDRATRITQLCDQSLFDCGPDTGSTGGGWDWPTGCGPNGYDSCVKGCPDYTCTGPYSPGDGSQYCGAYPDGSCGDTVIARWFPGMWVPGIQGPDGKPYMGDLICTVSLTTFDALCTDSASNSPTNWPPFVNPFASYDAGPNYGLITCKPWDKAANAFVGGFSSTGGRTYMGVYQVNAGTIFSARLTFATSVPNSSGIGIQNFPRAAAIRQTASCFGSGQYTG